MTAVEKYNSLDGKTVSREELKKILVLGADQGQKFIVDKIQKVLDQFEDPEFRIFISETAIDQVPDDILPGLEYAAPEEEFEGLEKAVSPDEIYQYITNLMLNTIKEVGHLPWQKEWKESSLANGNEALNWKTKKKYRGINYFLLNFKEAIVDGKIVMVPRNFTNPYFLTFNQIKESGGKLREGSKGSRIVYFTKLYKYEQAEPELSFGTYSLPKMVSWLKKNRSKISLMNSFSPESIAAQNAIPILKYYNVFSAEDVDGVEWDLQEPVVRTEAEKIEVADAMILKMPKAPKISHGGGRAYYMPAADYIQMPNKEDFRKIHSYYGTLFHEMVHSTGHHKRLDRDLRGGKGTKAYAFEELIAEMGAVYLCAESGILFETRDNSAKYLRGWNSRLVKNMEEDNRFFFRAASQAQAASDFILDRNKEGVPAYYDALVIEPKIEKPVEAPNKKTKAAFKKGDTAYYVDKKQNVTIRKVSIPKKGTSLEHENRVYDISYSNGRKAMAIPESKLEKAKKEDPKPKKKTVSKPKDTNQLLEEQKKTRLQAKTKIEFEKGLKKLGLEVISSSSKQKSPQEWSRVYKLNFKDISGVLLEMEFEKVKKVTKRKDEPQFAGTSKISGIGINTDHYIYYDSAKEFYEEVLEALKDLLDMSITEAEKLKKEYQSSLFQPEKPKTQLGLFGAKKKKKKSEKKKPGLKVAVDNEPTAAQPQIIQPNLPEQVRQPETEPVATMPDPEPNGAKSLAEAMRQQTTGEIFKVPGDIGRFLGQVEKKPVHSVVTTLDAEQGAGKTRFLFQVMNVLAGAGLKCLFISLEEHPASKLFRDKVQQYIDPSNLGRISTLEEIEDWGAIKDNVERADMIFIDSFQKLPANLDLDQDIRKAFNGKWFFIIYQQTGTKSMRGGSKAAFDGDQILKVFKDPEDYRNNYVYANKNRYNDAPDLNLNIFTGKLQGENIDPDPELTESREPQKPAGRLIATPVV